MAITMRLEMIEGRHVSKTLTFAAPRTVAIGRIPTADICLTDDPFISRCHACIELGEEQVEIRDVSSRNGFLVNSRQYGGSSSSGNRSVLLKDGDRIEIGETVMHLRFFGSDVAPSIHEEDTEDCPSTPNGVPRDTEDDAASIHIPGYSIDRMLGSGGMGSIYLVTEAKSGSKFAAKVLKESVSQKMSAMRRFGRETDVSLTLSHPNIVCCHDRDRIAQRVYLILEYIDGPDLDTLLAKRGGIIKLDEARSIITGMLEGMAFVHAQQIVHRDLKPSNILLNRVDDCWQAKISDLGLAKFYLGAGMSGITTTGKTGGTFAFMPPEQVGNFKYLKPVSDVFSLGATIYNMLSGDLVYDIASGLPPFELVVGGRIVPLVDRESTLPVPLVELVDRAIQKDPSDRWPDAGAMLADFEKVL